MSTEYFLTLLLAMVGGCVGASLGVRLKKKKVKKTIKRCPWVPCGFPTSATPLYFKMETDTHNPTYWYEKCAGCGNAIIWDRWTQRYVRFSLKGK
jgi:hypothetical protein